MYFKSMWPSIQINTQFNVEVKSYFTAGGLPPINFLGVKPSKSTTRGLPPLPPAAPLRYVTSSLTRRWSSLLWICLAFRQVYVSHIYHITEKSSFSNIYNPSTSTGFAEQIKPILRILCYNGSLVTWPVVSLTTTTTFKPLYFTEF
jgi:hypothetical protein